MSECKLSEWIMEGGGCCMYVYIHGAPCESDGYSTPHCYIVWWWVLVVVVDNSLCLCVSVAITNLFWKASLHLSVFVGLQRRKVRSREEFFFLYNEHCRVHCVVIRFLLTRSSKEAVPPWLR